MKVKATQPCPALCDRVDCTVRGILRARILQCLPFPSPGDLLNPGLHPRSPTLEVDSLPAEPPGKPENTGAGSLSLLKELPDLGIEPGSLPCRQIIYQWAKLASAEGNGPSVRFPHLETACKILHRMCMYVSMEVCRFSHL